jgi:hypothetical protein
VLQPPEFLERVSALKFQRGVETDCNLFRIAKESSGSSLQVIGNTESSTAQSDEQVESAVSETSASKDENTCLICWEKESDAILLECGHCGICIQCAQTLWHQTRHCPLCREGFAAIMHIVDRLALMVRCRSLCSPPPSPFMEKGLARPCEEGHAPSERRE